MATKKKKVDKYEVEEIKEIGIDIGSKKDETVLVYRVCRPVTDSEFEQIKNRLESQKTEGVNIVLAPYSVELEG